MLCVSVVLCECMRVRVCTCVHVLWCSVKQHSIVGEMVEIDTVCVRSPVCACACRIIGVCVST